MTDDTDDTAARRPGRPRDARADAAIVDATLELLGECGFGGVTVDAVAVRAGVGKSTIYRRWPCREALVLHAASTLVDLPEIDADGDLRADLLRITHHFVDHMRSKAGQLLPLLLAEASRDSELRVVISRFVEDRRAKATATVDRARDRGELREGVSSDLVVDAVVGPVLYRFLVTGAVVDDETIAEIVDAVLVGVATPARAGSRRRGATRG